ncbi:disease resistance protein RPV1-like [Nymphaea colorata]|nr:disease resistance protein RPV1-like [Nymphaea colorata]
MMVIPAFVILLILLTVIFRKVRGCFKAETTSDIVVSNQDEEINVENIGQEEPRTMVTSRFDVFLSFRGKDTRNGFTDHLYEGLQSRYVNTFRDSEGLKKGEKIEQLLGYIENSKVCIPVISEGYAHSKWCLKELAKMMECKKKIIPVFFKVNISDVKNQSGSFASGFEKHESKGKVKQEELIKWREALIEVGNISGFTLKDTNWKEGKLVLIIVKRILQELNPHHLHVGEYIIGHESHLEKLRMVLDVKSDDVRMIGIHGMGGIGKTTLVKAVHNEISSEFEACSFLFNVRGTSLVSLQQQLLKDIFQSDETFTHESKGTQLIKDKIGRKKVLIILDDVDSRDQLKALVGSRDWFRKGSRIIITTRDTEPLNKHVNRDELYELPVLNHDDSKKLFCYHAFGSEKPSISSEYAEMCDEALSFIKGLPLALEVLGSQFFDFDLKTEKQWRGTLARLKESQQKKIFEMLKLSFDSLDDNEKQVFLDIACFFVGKSRRRHKCWFDYFEVDDIKVFWEECGFHPEPAINVLKHKSLIKINKWEENYDSLEKWRFEMHDQIRDMGRKIVEDEGKACSRLWNDRKVIKTLRKQKAPSTTSIEGIMFQGEEEASDFSVPCLQEMDGLRLLHVQDAKFEGFPHLPEDLKWLGLPNCQHFLMPTSVSIPKEVTVLDLHDNDDVANVLLNKCISRSMVFDKLKVLYLSYMRITITPDFSMMPCLVKATFEYCIQLVEVDESVGQLKSLVWLSFRGCEKLEKFPDTICQLTSLEFFSLNHCCNLLYLPKQLGNMASLKHLDLRTRSRHIRSLPDTIRKLHVLEHLLIDGFIREISIASDSEDLVAASKIICWSAYILDVLPDPCCRRKIHLELIDYTVEELSPNFIRWENLELLILKCRSLKSLPVGIGQLPKLKVLEVYSDNHILVDDALPLASIEKLVLKCAVLQYFSSFNKKTQNLKHLILKSKKIQVLPDWIGSSSKLENLELRGCKIMESKVPADHSNTLRIAFVFENLKILSLDGDRMNVTPSFSYLPCLEKLTLTNCKELIEVQESIGSLKKLQFLKISGCTMLERLPDNICELRSLKSLDLKGCVNLSSLPEQLVDHMEMLEELCLDRTGIRSLPINLMAKLQTSLRSLSIKNCQSLKRNIPWSLTSCLESLRELYVIGSLFKGMSNNDFFELKSTGSLRASTSWEFMDALPISCCESVLKLCFTNERIEKLTDSIGRFEHVESLTLRCKMLKALPDSIGQLKNLEDLTLNCYTITLFDLIYLLESLERLKVECVEFVPLPFSSTTLGTSTTDQSNKSTVMKKLKELTLCAKQITVTPDFSFAPYLEKLTLRNCEMLIEVHDSVGTLEKLRNLEIKGCNSLEGLPYTIGHLTSLRHLVLSQHFGLFSSPEKLWDMELLKNLGLRETGINSILTSIEKLTQLWYLKLEKSCPGRGNFRVSKWEISSSCSELVTALPSSFLCSVKRLVITDDQIEALPDCIAQMQNLEYLELKCQFLKALPKWIGQLKQLRTFAVECDNIPIFIDEMCSWEHIEIWLRVRCLQLKAVTSSIEELKNVKFIELDLSETGIVELPPWLGCFVKLERLKLRNITRNNVLLSGLSQLTSLKELVLSESNFKSLPSCISSFSRLEMLNVSGCKLLHTIPHLSSSVLWQLDASNCTNLKCLPDFANLQSLRELSLGGCNSLECIPGFETIAENIEGLELPGPSGGIQCSNLSNDFKNKVFRRPLFRNLWRFKMGGNLIAGPHSGQQSMSFLFPDVRFNIGKRCRSLELILDGMISSVVDMAVVMEDDHVLFETRLAEDDFDSDDGVSKTFSFIGRDQEILKHLKKGYGTLLVSTDVSKLSRVELQATYL